MEITPEQRYATAKTIIGCLYIVVALMIGFMYLHWGIPFKSFLGALGGLILSYTLLRFGNYFDLKKMLTRNSQSTPENR